MVSDAEFAALTARVVALEAQVAGGAGGWGPWFKSTVDPILKALTPVLIVSATIWITTHIGGKVDAAKQSSDQAAAASEQAVVKSEANGAKLDAVKTEATVAATKADAAANTAAVAAERMDANHADAVKKIEDVKTEVQKPRPLFVPKAKE